MSVNSSTSCPLMAKIGRPVSRLNRGAPNPSFACAQ
jgi:hypothetical protein